MDLSTQGRLYSPRGLQTLEIENYTYSLPPYVRFTNFKTRKLNLNYIKKEFLWYLKGDKFDTSITESAKMWKTLINKDGSINSNYGQYIFGKINQFDNVVKILTKDKTSRRASIVILNSKHLLSETADYPCTYSLNFRIRNEKLNMTVRMRSQDAIYGMSNDAPAFSFIHELLYVLLRDTIYPNLKYGLYTHSADSFHIYEQHFKMLDELVGAKQFDPSEYSLVVCPQISSKKEVLQLLTLDFLEVPKEFEFTNWLINNNGTV